MKNILKIESFSEAFLQRQESFAKPFLEADIAGG
jgi:hypothetical protein